MAINVPIVEKIRVNNGFYGGNEEFENKEFFRFCPFCGAKMLDTEESQDILFIKEYINKFYPQYDNCTEIVADGINNFDARLYKVTISRNKKSNYYKRDNKYLS